MSGSRAAENVDGARVCHVIQGDFHVSDDPGIMMTTILGSCVATCLCDPVARVGGMNHFLLPQGSSSDGSGYRYGLLAMELLINGLLKKGASKTRLEAKLFGGARMNDSLARIGEANSAFALDFLRAEGIRCLSQSLGGSRARRIRYVPTTGAAQQRVLADHADPAPALAPRPSAGSDDNVTLF